MGSGLQRVGGTRLVHLRYSDAPRVAQAMVDVEFGQAKVHLGVSNNAPYVQFVRDHCYTVVVRGDDWRKIFPFLRYSDSAYKPVFPPGIQPSPIPSPQPNRMMQPPPVNPAGGFTSFLAGFTFDEYSRTQKLLTTVAVNSLDPPAGAGVPSRSLTHDRSALSPPQQQTDFTDYRQAKLYNKLVQLLQQLFPTDFPRATLRQPPLVSLDITYLTDDDGSVLTDDDGLPLTE